MGSRPLHGLVDHPSPNPCPGLAGARAKPALAGPVRSAGPLRRTGHGAVKLLRSSCLVDAHGHTDRPNPDRQRGKHEALAGPREQ